MATTKITTGKSFFRAVEYDLGNGLNKDDREKIKSLPATDNETIAEGFKEGRRSRLIAANIPGDSVAELAEQFKIIASQKPNKKEAVHKVSINLKPGEHLKTHQWLEVGNSYLKEMGYGNAPYLIVQHREKEHEHIHIITSKVDFNSEIVSDSFERRRARTWAKHIEEKYDLSPTAQKATEKGLTRIEIEQALKTSKPPPKLILQETIKKTLEKYRETGEFIEALEKQNISLCIKTNREKEILGISFGLNGHGFKGSNLGQNFTWQGLQQNGLIYEHQRDFEKLEKASLRASRGEFERNAIERIVESSVNNFESSGIAEFDRFRRNERFGEKREFGLGNQIKPNQSSVEPTSLTAESANQFLKKGNGAIETGNEGEFRRSGQFNQREIETSGGIESEIFETTSAEADETFIPAIGQNQAVEWTSSNTEFLRQQQADFLKQFSEDNSAIVNQGNELLGGGNSDLSPTGTTDNANPLVVESNEFNGLGNGTSDVAFDPVSEGNLADNERNRIIDYDRPGNNSADPFSNNDGDGNNLLLSGDSLSDAGDESSSRSLMSKNLIESLDKAEAAFNEIAAIQIRLDAEKKEEEAEIETDEIEDAIEFEERVLSL